ncbi:MAG: hypothetical protein J5486_06520 [Bacteroidaceae bacterium]|nr:hypothetical protein [Bacteroidaceae bacterium]
MNFSIFNKTVRHHSTDHVLQLQQRVTEAILQQVQPIYGLNPQTYLCLWIDGVQHGLALDNDDYRRQLRLALDNNGYGNVTVEQVFSQKPSRSQKTICVEADHVWITLTSTPYRESFHTSATVQPIGFIRQLDAEKYALDSDNGHRWQIGRGKAINRPGLYRVNDVVFAEDSENVAAMQADITWLDGVFYITPCPSGCSAMGGVPTTVLHDNAVIDLLSPVVATPLADGDIIEIGNQYKLRFTLN